MTMASKRGEISARPAIRSQRKKRNQLPKGLEGLKFLTSRRQGPGLRTVRWGTLPNRKPGTNQSNSPRFPKPPSPLRHRRSIPKPRLVRIRATLGGAEPWMLGPPFGLPRSHRLTASAPQRLWLARLTPPSERCARNRRPCSCRPARRWPCRRRGRPWC